MSTQLTLFGTEVTNIDDIERGRKTAIHKTATMQQMYGTIEGWTCKTCEHCYRESMSKAWYKCELWMRFFKGHSSASDIRLKNQACKQYKEREKE